MKVAVYSDLHIELGQFKFPDLSGVDVLLLAGDINIDRFFNETAFMLEKLLKDYPNLKICYVPGNHEYYGSSIERVYLRFKTLNNVENRLFMMQNDLVEIDGYKIFGATLWSDMKNEDPTEIYEARYRMNDYRFIGFEGRLLNPFDTIKFHKETVEKIKALDDVDIIMTHHKPYWSGIPRGLDGAYQTELGDLILDKHPKLWVYGHTHQSDNTIIGETKVFANPRGYVNREENKEFKEVCVLDV